MPDSGTRSIVVHPVEQFGGGGFPLDKAISVLYRYARPVIDKVNDFANRDPSLTRASGPGGEGTP